ncbi:conjugative transposon TraN protein [Dysgonomonas sp. PFB1-18]|uniref:conjugative transposon protein TraN n=1 Tax=unclassified Dysgonomonas TaxID=2630389 RepID=UPI0013D238A6|nr:MULTISPECIES: conjugative transposon protein TraN [unclassified Dysgonomonas]MDH6310004.1 conjugative transposon TraN protein [Dysgonomonas sp. PF1-14]MDH6339913.1 conjugative transposon TraN protein [Dysgonomonas sp. PF1-16]MDH6381561.1 conjugative transposon TraN protein [Dysgonomonas sp. PFB1-18]MDH6398802.1 conjugative transposon TraN protein [Dysgonomonas sp. PF1-23]NDV93646.1 conjugative transposon protein TraN [Dysgonomonas sp. 521]
MKKYILLFALAITTIAINAQTEEAIPVVNQTQEEMQEDLQQVLKPTYGDYYEGLSKKITFDRMIPPYGLEVTFDKTVHIIFPAPIQYVDLGSNRIIAGKAGTSENILRVKAALRSFETETNMAVITNEGSYYTFNVKYADEPEKLNIEMKDFMHDGIATNRPNNSMDIYLKELGSESPRIVYLINRAIYNTDKRLVKHIGSKRFGIQYLLKGIYSHNNLLYLHTSIKNASNVSFDIDFVRMKIIDKKVAKQTAIQETVIHPLRAYNFISTVGGNKTERTVFAIDKVTIPNDKKLVIELFEKNGGRNQSFVIENEDLLRAEEINELKVK